MIFRWIRAILSKWIPEDPSPQCGYGPLSLPIDHPFTRGCALHDFAFLEAKEGVSERSLEEEDILLFRRWFYIATNASSVEERIMLLHDICRYWPLARGLGPYLWEGRLLEEEK